MTLEEIDKEIEFYKNQFEDAAASYAFLNSERGRAISRSKVDRLIEDGVDDAWAEMIVSDKEYSVYLEYERAKANLEKALKKREELLNEGAPGKK